MSNCKLQISDFSIFHFSFCTLHFAFLPLMPSSLQPLNPSTLQPSIVCLHKSTPRFAVVKVEKQADNGNDDATHDKQKQQGLHINLLGLLCTLKQISRQWKLCRQEKWQRWKRPGWQSGLVQGLQTPTYRYHKMAFARFSRLFTQTTYHWLPEKTTKGKKR